MTEKRKLLESEIRTILLVGLYEFAQEKIGDDAIKIFDWIDTAQYSIKNRFKGTIEDLTLNHLIAESNYTISNTLSNQIFAKAKELLPGDDPLYEEGIHFIKNNKLVKSMSSVIRRVPPRFMLTQTNKENKNYNNILDSIISFPDKNSAVVDLQFYDGITKTTDGFLQGKAVCDQYRGCIAGYLEILGIDKYQVEETKCVTLGDDHCRYEMSWENKKTTKNALQRFVLTLFAKDLLKDMQKEIGDNQHLVFDLETQIKARTTELEETVHQLKDANTKLDRLARYDFLTEIPNRQYFNEYFQEKWDERRHHNESENREMYVLLGDLDFFKLYNDTYGHIKGDTCLTTVAKTIANSLRKTDFAARYGGEEFVVVLPSEEISGVKIVANNILNNIQKERIPHIKSIASDYVSISIGIAKIDSDCKTIAEFLNHADKALYRAKDSGRNQFKFYDPSIDHD